MRLLLDTHALIWWDEGDTLDAPTVDAIREADQVYVSAVSGWEIAIKASIGRLETTRSVVEAVRESGFEELPVRLSHGEALRALPMHHRDPFDRMLVAQAQAEGMVLVSRDEAMTLYDVRVLPA